MRRDIDLSQPGAEVHSLVPGCGEERVLRGEKITPEYVAGFAADWAAIQDAGARAFCRRLLEVMLGREAAGETLGG